MMTRRGISRRPPRGLASLLALLALAASGCADGGGDHAAGPGAGGEVVRCYAAAGSSGMCVESFEPLSDTMRLSLIAKCREVDGKIVDACPTKHLIGTCELTENTKLAWTMNRTTRVSHYRHPDVVTPEVIEKIASRCPKWIPPPAVEGGK